MIEAIKNDQILKEIVQRLADAFEPELIYLFGSRARGDDGLDADYDIMVVVPDDAPSDKKSSRLAYRVLRGTGTAVDVLVWTRSAFERKLHLRSSLPSTIQREGIVLHAA